MRVENWCGHEIRFVEQDGEWWAILKDICDALNLHTFKVFQRLDPSMITRVRVEVCDIPSREVRSRARKTQDMLAVNEFGIYEALFASRRLEARKFRQWSATVMQKLRRSVGLEGYEVMKMTDPDVQEEIDHKEGGKLEPFTPMKKRARDLYIITTAKKRDSILRYTVL